MWLSWVIRVLHVLYGPDPLCERTLQAEMIHFDVSIVRKHALHFNVID